MACGFLPICTVVLMLCSTALHAQQSSRQQAAESAYSEALVHIDAGKYGKALGGLRKLQKRYPDFKSLSAVQTRIAVLQESADAGASLPVFLAALNLRDAGDIDNALLALGEIALAHPGSTLADDALYISAYLLVMDRYDFQAARLTLQRLQQRFPDSAYSDSAQYLDAIALEQLGDTEGARRHLVALRDRHTALDLPLNFRWPRGSVLSRYWFDRADRRLAIVEERVASASRLDSRQKQGDGKLRVELNVNGVDMRLLLLPSPLTRQTQWLDAGLADQLPPAIGVFDGVVDGVANSWVRVILDQNTIRGVVNIDGEQHRLQPANLIGTLDYYQPRSRKPGGLLSKGSSLATSLQGLDVLIAPPADTDATIRSRARNVQTDMRAVPLSIVVDSQYDRYYAGGGLAAALNNLNIADGVYRQFGLALSLDEALNFSDEADPLKIGAVPLETILREFRDYRLQYKTLFEDSALTYLFTGNPKTDITLGLAWIDTACRLDGYDVGVTTPSSFGDVLLTHELGHSLGAQHDTDTECNQNSQSLMWPNISERTESAFSSCSKSSVLRSRTKTCLQNSVDLGLLASANGASVGFKMINPDGALTLDAQLVVESSTPGQLILPAGCQSQTPTSAVCYIDALQPMEQRSISFAVNAQFADGSAPVTGQLTPLGILELQADDNLVTVTVDGSTSVAHLDVNEVNVGGAAGDVGQQPSAANAAGGALSYYLLFGMLIFRLLGLSRLDITDVRPGPKAHF